MSLGKRFHCLVGKDFKPLHAIINRDELPPLAPLPPQRNRLRAPLRSAQRSDRKRSLLVARLAAHNATGPSRQGAGTLEPEQTLRHSMDWEIRMQTNDLRNTKTECSLDRVASVDACTCITQYAKRAAFLCCSSHCGDLLRLFYASELRV